MLELLEMEGVVDVDDDDLRGALQEGEMGHQVALEDQDVAPLLELPQLGLVDAANREARMSDRARLIGDQFDVVLQGQSSGHVPRPDAGARHLGRQGVARRHHDPTPTGQPLAYAEGVGDCVHRRRERLLAVRLEGDAEEAHDLPVGACAGRLYGTAGLRELGEELDEGIDGEGRRNRLLRDVESAVLGARHRMGKVEGMGLVAAADHCPLDGEKHCRGEHPREVLVVVVLVDREEGIALEEVVLAPRAEPRHARVVPVVHE